MKEKINTQLAENDRYESLCPTCNKAFTLTHSEIEWYKEKHLCLPSRCADCRRKSRNEARARERAKQIQIELSERAADLRRKVEEFKNLQEELRSTTFTNANDLKSFKSRLSGMAGR